jgi:hypothetical protein
VGDMAMSRWVAIDQALAIQSVYLTSKDEGCVPFGGGGTAHTLQWRRLVEMLGRLLAKAPLPGYTGIGRHTILLAFRLLVPNACGVVRNHGSEGGPLKGSVH